MSTSPRRRFESVFIALLLCSDLAICTLAVLLAFAFRVYYGRPLLTPLGHPLMHYLTALPVVLAIWLLVFTALGMYQPRRTLHPIAARAAEFRAVSLTALLIAAASFLSHRSYSRGILVEFWAIAVLLLWCSRALLGRYHRHMLKTGRAMSRALIVGAGDLGHVVLGRLRSHNFGLQPIGFVVVDGKGLPPGSAPASPVASQDDLPILGTLADLPDLLVTQHIDEVLVADPGVAAGPLMEAIGASEKLQVEFSIVAGPLQVLIAQTELSGPADLPILELPHRAFGPIQRLIKRFCDILAALVLIIITSPLLVYIVLAIRRQTGETALFLQKRIGYRGHEFVMYKFRTMHSDADAYAPSPDTPQDGRVTPIGRWLRRYSLDELPQLFNVLRGEMSIVGPRPEMPFIVAQYEPWQLRRLEALPGMTGLWQILGRKDLPLRGNLEYDFYYIRNQSLLLDLAIFLRTIPLVVLGRGAY